jgi:hypothetical protein
VNAALRPPENAQPARRLTDRAVHLWRAVRALPADLAREQLALFVGDAVRVVDPADRTNTPVARSVRALAPVAGALAQPVELEGWDADDPDAPVAWRAAVLPLENGAALAVVSQYRWRAPPEFTSWPTAAL